LSKGEYCVPPGMFGEPNNQQTLTRSEYEALSSPTQRAMREVYGIRYLVLVWVILFGLITIVS
jgi:hypothetical protein